MGFYGYILHYSYIDWLMLYYSLIQMLSSRRVRLFMYGVDDDSDDETMSQDDTNPLDDSSLQAGGSDKENMN